MKPVSKERTGKILGMADLSNAVKTRVKRYSPRMKQCLDLVAALLGKCRILVLDVFLGITLTQILANNLLGTMY
ncbi:MULTISPECIES: hypothetical protein [Oceanobacillus]|uniref:hypothetical protein n=1 Tax=Oceanobacillus TaxID=182709 RepID=UPI000B196A4A